MNPDKTEFIYFGSQVQLNKCVSDSICVCGDDIGRSRSIRYLGGYLDSEMTLKEHIKTKCASAMANFNKIRQIRRFLTDEACATLILGLVMSHIDYSNGLLTGVPDSTIYPFQRLQNMCAKLILKRSKFDSSTASLRQLHWLPIRARIEFKTLTLMFQVVHGNAPSYLKDMIQRKAPGRQLRSTKTSDYDFVVPMNRNKTFGDRSFRTAGPVAWNSLPYELKTISDYRLFKIKCKTHLFNKYF